MSAKNSDSTPAPQSIPSTTSVSSKMPVWLRWLTPGVQRTTLWLGVAAIGTYAMGAAVESFFAKKQRDKDADVAEATNSGGGGGWAARGAWWDPTAASTDIDIPGSGDTGSQIAPYASSRGGSVIPVDRASGFSTGSLIVGNMAPIGGNSSHEAYSILGLGTRSFSGGGGFSQTLALGNLSLSELHFSLAGDLNLVPVDNLSTSGLGAVTLATVPEPSTAGLLGMALAGMVFRRRRNAVVMA